MNDERNFFDQQVKNDKRTYDDIQKTRNCQDYYLKKHNMIVIDLGKQQQLEADPNAIQQINFIRNLDWVGNTTLFFIFEESKETLLNFH